jgi:hypothetical protein
MKYSSEFVGLIGLIFLITGCSVDQDVQNELVIDVDDDFQVRLVENLQTPANDLIWILESIRNPDCAGDTLLAEVLDFGNALRLDVELIPQMGNCLPATQKLQTQVSTAPLEISRIPISINFQELVPNRGELLVGDRDFQLNMETTHGFYLPYKKLQRVPDNLVWGYVSFGSVYRQFAQEFLDRLALITEKRDLDPGAYGYFEISGEKEITVFGQEKEPFNAQAFYGFYEFSKLASIRALVQEYQEEFPGMRFFVINSYGKVLSE